jgi:hypothetical protein
LGFLLLVPLGRSIGAKAHVKDKRQAWHSLLRQRDIDGAQAAVGSVDVEGHGLTFIQGAGIGRQVDAMHEHVAPN